MAKHQQLSGELFFGNNIRTNINTTHSDAHTHKFTLEIIISQAAGRPISLEYSKYQAINGNYCFDNIQCSCMHIFLSFFYRFVFIFILFSYSETCILIFVTLNMQSFYRRCHAMSSN